MSNAHAVEGLLQRVEAMAVGDVRFVVDLDDEPVELRTTPEQAQVILTKCRLGSQVRVTTSVDMEPVPVEGTCGEYRTWTGGASCIRPAGHSGSHGDHRVTWGPEPELCAGRNPRTDDECIRDEGHYECCTDQSGNRW